MPKSLNVVPRDRLVLGPVQGGRQYAGGKDAGGTVLKQKGHPLGSSQAYSKTVPPDWGPLVVGL
jgi:hypothetical protein